MNPQWLKRSLYLSEVQNCHDAFMKRWLVLEVLWVLSGGRLKTLDEGRAREREQAPCVRCWGLSCLCPLSQPVQCCAREQEPASSVRMGVGRGPAVCQALLQAQG